MMRYVACNCFVMHLVGWFWVYRPFETVFQSISGRLPKRGRKRKERIDESKNVQTTPPAPTASAVGPCPTVIQIVGRPGTGSLPSTIAPPDHPRFVMKLISVANTATCRRVNPCDLTLYIGLEEKISVCVLCHFASIS